MNIYLVERPGTLIEYDSYDSFIVVAKCIESARKTSPSECYEYSDSLRAWEFVFGNGKQKICKHHGWIDDLSSLKITMLGIAGKDISPGVMLASFNAG